VVKLNDLVVEALGKAGASPMPVHPFSCTLLKEGRIECFAVAPLQEMIRDGLLPVMHGDVAMDMTRKAGIVSGDQLVAYIARALRAEIVAVGTNVDGVLISGSPKKDLRRSDLSFIEKEIGEGSGVDVTGGMRGKLLELLNLADEGNRISDIQRRQRRQHCQGTAGEFPGTKVGRAN